MPKGLPESTVAAEREPAKAFDEQRPTVERAGASRSAYSRRYPKVIGGVCEACGVKPGIASEEQYKHCRHYHGMELRCSYCDETQDPAQVVAHHSLNIAEHPENPAKLVVWCGSFKCLEAHRKRFTTARE